MEIKKITIHNITSIEDATIDFTAEPLASSDKNDAVGEGYAAGITLTSDNDDTRKRNQSGYF